ncbi:respiratory nitrate reductase subunit gamma [Actinomadura rupiterrae]|uniref:respiratory nitrate reductase subunit gamma n=1 Tax=Actinomadura rupiterrae TaxID=559627 RepID=UPI0027E2A229|nr:respiratory nitrate reductase subunit gamma [Actinomadura rupiterrae]
MLWAVLPYLAVASLVGGTIWRRRHDRSGWTTKSSEIYGRTILGVAGPLFRYALAFVILGHVLGLVIPESWTRSAGVADTTYRQISMIGGTVAGVMALAGLAMLVHRRRTSGPVLSATTRHDRLMYVLLGGSLLLGTLCTIVANGNVAPYDYRLTIAPWFRGLFLLRPDASLMASVPVLYKLHVLVGMALIALFPFTRLVHVFAAPWSYVFRPSIVYRTPERWAARVRAPRRGWALLGRR